MGVALAGDLDDQSAIVGPTDPVEALEPDQ
jgi:hypothetical protein